MCSFIFKRKCIRGSLSPLVLSQHPSPACSPAEIPLKTSDPGSLHLSRSNGRQSRMNECAFSWKCPLNSSVQVSQGSNSEPICCWHWAEAGAGNCVFVHISFDITLGIERKDGNHRSSSNKSNRCHGSFERILLTDKHVWQQPTTEWG